MRRALASVSVVITGLVACRAGTSSPTLSDASPDTIDVAAFPARLNPELPGGMVLYMGGGEGCHGILASVDVPDLVAAINKSEPTTCAPLTDPAWKECRFGAVYARPDRSKCVCRATGTPARTMACPR